MNKSIPAPIREHLVHSASAPAWQRIGSHKRAGVLAPLFSLYSRQSCGIGDFSDLKLLIDWAQATGNTIVQLLPMNEVGGVFCPYDSISSFALEPSYISISALARHSPAAAEEAAGLQKAFPAGKGRVDYGVKKAKEEALRRVFAASAHLKSPEFAKFIDDNAYWLDAFAFFKVLKAYYDGLPWYEWEQVYRDRVHAGLSVFAGKCGQELTFQKWMQWTAYLQFAEAKAYARSKGVLLKGDLPILVSRDSADVWQHPEYFKLESAAGAPPDMYCAKGQRWGMPTYQWGRIAADGYTYLKEKIAYARHFYDIIRVDHVVGLFRIWSIPFAEPFENQGLHGAFDPPDEHAWEGQGKHLLSQMLSASEMLLCAEDLGVIPPSCTRTLYELGIPGNDVQRWVKDWNHRHDFLPAQEYRAMSVAMLSTHDTTTWLGWWENEAGTVDEALFTRKCEGRVDYPRVKGRLFDPLRSRNGRLRWREEVSSVEALVRELGRPREELNDFVDMYLNTFMEKEKFWALAGLPGAMREKGDADILAAALQQVMKSSAVFAIQLITDLLGLAPELFTQDAYHYRINTPGTISSSNWSLTMPLSLEDLLSHPVTPKVKAVVSCRT